MERNFGNGLAYMNILKSVYPDKEIRDVCTNSVSQLNKLAIEIKWYWNIKKQYINK